MSLLFSNTLGTALQNKANPSPLSPIGGGNQTSTPAFNSLAPKQTPEQIKYGSTPSAISSILNPKTDVKKVTVGADGSHSVEFHPTDTSSQQAGIMAQIQKLQQQKSAADSAGYGANEQIQQDANGNVLPKVQQQNQPGGSGGGSSYGGIINQLVQKGQGPSQDYTDQQKEANAYNEALKQSRINEAKGLAANAMHPRSLNIQQGRAGILQSQYAQEQAALGSAFQGASTLQGAANTQQGLQQSALGAAGQMAAPQMQAGMLTNPVTGQPLNPQLVASAVESANKLVANGAAPDDPQVQALLAPFGFYGTDAFTRAQLASSGGGYNPTSANAQAHTNTALGSATQQQAFNLGTALKLLDNYAPIAVNFLNQSGINPTNSPVWNGPIKNYIASLGNPAATTQMDSIMNDIKSVAAQIIANKTPGTPTSTTEMTAAQDPSLLSGAQLTSVLDTWKTMGQATSNALESQKTGAYGNSGGYTGTPTNPTPTTAPVATPNNGFGGGVSSIPGQYAAGLGIAALPGAAQATVNGAAAGAGADAGFNLTKWLLNFIKF